jgi:hypothetical protein
MNENNKISGHNQWKPGCCIARNIEEGGYLPDWREKVVEEYVIAIIRQRHDEATTCQAERDEFVRHFLEFQLGRLSPEYQPVIEGAIRCQKDEQISRLIKAMVIADCSIEQISAELGPSAERIYAFEQIFFDARRYRDRKGWLKSICRGDRWLEVARSHGWPGVQEIVLNRPANGARTLNRSFSVLLGRVQDGVHELEERNVSPGDKDIERLCKLSQISKLDQIPLLDDPVESEKPSNVPDSIARLTPASRERVFTALSMAVDITAKKESALKDAAQNGSGAKAEALGLPARPEEDLKEK